MRQIPPPSDRSTICRHQYDRAILRSHEKRPNMLPGRHLDSRILEGGKPPRGNLAFQLRAMRKGWCLKCSCFPSVELAQAKPPFMILTDTRVSSFRRFLTLHLAVATLSEICLLSISKRCFFDNFLIRRESVMKKGRRKEFRPLRGEILNTLQPKASINPRTTPRLSGIRSRAFRRNSFLSSDLSFRPSTETDWSHRGKAGRYRSAGSGDSQ